MLLKDVIKELDMLVGTIAKLKAASEQEMPKRSGLSYYYLRHLPVEVRFQTGCAGIMKNLAAASDVLKKAFKEGEPDAELSEWEATLVVNQIHHSPDPFLLRIEQLPDPDQWEGWQPEELEEGSDLWVHDKIFELRADCLEVIRSAKFKLKLDAAYEPYRRALLSNSFP